MWVTREQAALSVSFSSTPILTISAHLIASPWEGK
jgi:hypothetical protein